MLNVRYHHDEDEIEIRGPRSEVVQLLFPEEELTFGELLKQMSNTEFDGVEFNLEEGA